MTHKILIVSLLFTINATLALCEDGSTTEAVKAAGKNASDAVVNSTKKVVEKAENMKDEITGKGPAQKLGESIDDTAESVKDAVLDKGPIEKAGEKVDDVVDSVKK